MSTIKQIQALVRNGLYYPTEHAYVEAEEDGLSEMGVQRMGFWENETCEYCGGPVVEKRVTLHRKVKGGYVLIENVPARACRECGTHCYAANADVVSRGTYQPLDGCFGRHPTRRLAGIQHLRYRLGPL
ncbi:MAG: YgiT-type zinc finger protein [Sedimentisphaerales bacterium]|nr:YgiT-type zinc finger protein [Sedimentisphaerales bacterium]